MVEYERGQTEGGEVLERGWWSEREGGGVREGRQRVVKCYREGGGGRERADRGW